MRHTKSQADSETLEGSIERVTFHSEETGFSVLQVKVRGHRELVPVVGRLPHVVAGEWIQARGEWVMDREHGRQFKASDLHTTPPDSREGIEKFLGSGLIRGIGPVYAGKLVEKFGTDVLDIIEDRSALLEDVDGIGRVRRERIKQSWNEAREIRRIMTFLLGHGVSTNRAFRIYKTYGDRAVETVRDNPYVLARDIRGIGFKTADELAGRLGIEPTSPLRARAGVEHVLQELTQQGHCAFPRPDLIRKTAEILDVPEELIEQAVADGLQERRLVREAVGGRGDLVYLQTLHDAEVRLTRDLLALASGPHPCPSIRADKALDWVQEKIGFPLEAAQQRAFHAALREKVLLLTGGPGVGKTTLVNAIVKVLSAKRLQIELCAPTGRAAKRMSETSGRPARTLHRLLEFDPHRGGFKRNADNPLEGDVFVVDEASMIDLLLASQLIRALPPHAALILVGDVDQLPSVGPGTVLRDLIRSERFNTCILQHIFRQAARSDIVASAHNVNAGRMPKMTGEDTDTDFFFVEASDPDVAAERITRLVSRAIPRRFGFDPMEDIQVLAPMQRGALGARSLNARLQETLNPRGDTIERYAQHFRAGDRVMQTENDYDKDVYNGDMGRIRKIDRDMGEVVVRFGERDVRYAIQELDELLPAYAITIHKSQGSEYPAVVIPVHTQHYVMLRRNLLYTAITRGRKLVVLVGLPKAVAMAVDQTEAHERITTLCDRLCAAP